MLPELLHHRVNTILSRKGWAIPGGLAFIGGAIWDIWLLSGHFSTGTWLYSLLPNSWKQGWHMPQVSALGPPFWMVVVGLAWLALLAFVPPRTRSHAITGGADLLIHRLHLHDLQSVATDWASYAINLGVFVRAVIWVTDKPRTIRSFVLELTVDSRTYSAESEREIGDYLHRYTREEPAQYGYGGVWNDVDEEMESLLAITRTPLLPGTHAEGWLHFEIKNVNGGDELRGDAVYRLYALDAAKNRYPMNTENMIVRRIDSHEYAWPKQR